MQISFHSQAMRYEQVTPIIRQMLDEGFSFISIVMFLGEISKGNRYREEHPYTVMRISKTISNFVPKKT